MVVAGQGAGAQDHSAHAGHAARQAEVAQRGAAVMPFDLERTLHRFEPGAAGGVVSVIAKGPDAEQTRLARAHLKEESVHFARGDYRSPAAIHGGDMPGLAALQAGASRVKVAYAEVPGGAQVSFTTADPALVGAIHRWFAAQVSDHGRHAGH